MKIRAQVDTRGLDVKVRAMRKALAYGTVAGINRTAQGIQKAEREQLERVFTLRGGKGSAFLMRRVAVIKPFASVRTGTLFAEVFVSPADRLLLPLYEGGGERRPFKGKSMIAQPIIGGPVRPTLASTVTPSLFVGKLGLRQSGRGSKKQIKGKAGTFVLPGVGIMQAEGPARPRLLYYFRKPYKLKATLRWLDVANRYAQQFLTENIKVEIARELARSKR